MAASMTSGPIPSPAITAILAVGPFPSARPGLDRSPSASHSVCRLPARPLQAFADRTGFEPNIAALAREQPQYRHLVVLMGRDAQVRAVGAIGHEPLVYFCRRERDRDSGFSGEGGDQQAKQSIELVHYAP